jgi:HipA-like C-terminal domain
MPSDPVSVLRSRGRLRGGELARALGVSRATLMRLVRTAGEALVVRGQARRTTYATRRPLRGSMLPLPIYRAGADGNVHEAACLELVHPAFATAVTIRSPWPWPLEGEMVDGWFDGLPYPLYDMRPQGFLGRQFARRHAEQLQVDANPEAWTDDDVLHVLSLLGDDVPGDLIVGDVACRRFVERVHGLREDPSLAGAIADREVGVAYPKLAWQALAEGVAGSSAAGEFPKFAALRLTPDGALRHVLVKFSGDDMSEGTRRWSDLLRSEHLALETVRDELVLPAAVTRLVAVGGRSFLEIERFDRHGLFGRSPVLSWAALNGAFFGVAARPWGEVGRLLAGRGWLSVEDGAALQRLAIFGALIANSDMHDGNLAFCPAPGGVQLAPVYDMLPMRYAPQRGVELAAVRFVPRPPLPSEQAVWTDAACAALRFWQRLEADQEVSVGFRTIAGANAATLNRLLRP